MEDIYGREKELERMIEKIKKDKKITNKNRRAIVDFLDYCRANGMSVSRLLRYAHTLRKLSAVLKKDFKEATRRDIQRIIGKIESSNYKAWTKYTFKVMIKRFWKWLKGGDRKYPEEVEWIKARLSKKDEELPEELLTEEEIKAMVDAADNLRDRALISVLYESGCRVGEVLSLKVKHVWSNEYGCKALVKGKTGMRKILLITSAPYLATWINSHPFKDDPDAPLWVEMKGEERKGLSYSGLSTMLKRVAEKAGIKKRIYPHLFRHSRATELAKHLTESQLKAYMGWVQSSKMAGVYVHLAGRDVDDALLEMHGIKRGRKKDGSKLKPRKCPRCGTTNEATNRFCKSCGSPLDMKTALEVEEKRKAYDEIISEVLAKNPEISRLIVQKAIEMGLERKLKEMV